MSATAASFLMNLLEGAPMPTPAPKTWPANVTVAAPEEPPRLTPSQCPVLYDLCIGMHNRITDLDTEEQRLLARLDLLRRERDALQSAYATMLGFVIPDSIRNAAKSPLAQEEGEKPSADKITPLLRTPA